MMKKMLHTIFTALVICLAATMCTEKPSADVKNGGKAPEEVKFRWDFDSAEGWIYTHQDTATIAQWSVEKGSLYLRTRANTRDRSKMRTMQDDFTEGIYTWKIFIPNIAPYEQVSIAGFIYMDDEHELDFEIGYGTARVRDEYGASQGDLLACMTNQAHPLSSTYAPISQGWHTFSIRMDVKDGKYVAAWLIDNAEQKKIPLDFGPSDARFRIMCSVENLEFIGEHIPAHDNYARFDYVNFEGKVASTYKDPGKPVSKTFKAEGDIPAEDGTEVSVFNLYGMSRFTLDLGEKVLRGEITESEDYVALFPYNETASVSESKVSTVFLSSQKAVSDRGDCTMLSIASGGREGFRFDNILSHIGFTLGEDLSGISEIRIAGNDGELLCGPLSVDIESLDAKLSGDGKSLSLQPENSGVFGTGKRYYASVLPGTFSKGLSMTFIKEGRSIKHLIDSKLTFAKGELADLGAISDVEKWEETRWDFDKDITGWHYYTHSVNPVREYYEVSGGNIKIWTLANSMDRNKIHTNRRDFGAGIYTWRVYVSDVAPGEKASIGAFIYADDTHELDFEIGYGRKEARASCNAQPGEMVACMTNQGLPTNSTYTPITVGWHVVAIRLDVEDGRYVAQWYIDDVLQKTLRLQFGPETRFLISCSVENLEFMGEHMPTHENYALFDYVSYQRLIQ